MENIYLSTLKMFLVVVAIAAAVIIFYRYSGKLKLNLGLKPAGRGYGLQKGETIHLGYRKFVSVLEVKDRVLVIGVGDKEMSLLASWKKEEEAE
jgi:flagellar biogenesis protein FliO